MITDVHFDHIIGLYHHHTGIVSILTDPEGKPTMLPLLPPIPKNFKREKIDFNIIDLFCIRTLRDISVFTIDVFDREKVK